MEYAAWGYTTATRDTRPAEADTDGMNHKLLALALIRATVEEDLDALGLLLAQNPPTPELVSELVTFTAGVLEHGLGPERARQAIDGWMRAVLAEESKR